MPISVRSHEKEEGEKKKKKKKKKVVEKLDPLE